MRTLITSNVDLSGTIDGQRLGNNQGHQYQPGNEADLHCWFDTEGTMVGISW